MDIKVSVVMAVYNSEKYLRKAIDSILAQTLQEFELILVDDGSEDSSFSVLKEYEAADNRVHVFANEKESDGAAEARNLGISKAKGLYLSVLDSDDFFEPDMLEKAYAKAVMTGEDAVVFDGYRFDDLIRVDLERDNILCRDYLPKGKEVFSPEENYEALFQMTLGAAWDVLFRRSFIEENDLRFKSFHHADDLEFVYLGFAMASRIAVLPERLVHYRVNHAGSQASGISNWPDTAWKAMLSFKDSLINRGIYEKYRIAYLRKALQYVIFYIGRINNSKGFCSLYNELHNGELKELGLCDISPEELGDKDAALIRDLIRDVPVEEYLFRKLYKESPFDLSTAWKRKVPQKSRLVLYGADRLGVDVFYSILWNLDYEVAAWVDPQYEKLGYPVMAPQEIKDLEYDFVLVTSTSERVYNKARDLLKTYGADEAKVLWIADL